MYRKMLETIKAYKDIVIYRHINPDYDAYGSQFGLKQIIEDNFKDKRVYVDGEDNFDYIQRMHISPYSKRPNDLTNFLAIILDTANLARVDGELSGAKETIKVDHHIVVEPYGQLRIEEPEASSASELVTQFYEINKDDLFLSKEAASYLYYGLIGDTNRFLYEGVTERTFKSAIALINSGISITDIYQSMYLESKKEIELKRFIYNRYKSKGKVAYYVIYDEDLVQLNLSRQKASEKVHLLADIDEFEVWMAITENKIDHNFRVSIRSRNVTINSIANKYRGGGHRLASGATLQSLDELDGLLTDLNQAISDYEKE